MHFINNIFAWLVLSTYCEFKIHLHKQAIGKDGVSCFVWAYFFVKDKQWCRLNEIQCKTYKLQCFPRRINGSVLRQKIFTTTKSIIYMKFPLHIILMLTSHGEVLLKPIVCVLAWQLSQHLLRQKTQPFISGSLENYFSECSDTV